MNAIRIAGSALSALRLASLTIALMGAAWANADTNVFVDNFEQFAPGTDLSNTNYLPSIGTTVNVSSHGAGTSGIVTDLFGSRGLYVNLGASPNPFTDVTYYDYTNGVSQAVSNHVVSISWDVMFQNTNVAAGYTLYLPCLPSYPYGSYGGGMSYVLDFPMGTIIQWLDANNPVYPGSFGDGILTTNKLDLNLASGTYDYTLNGVKLISNTAIPADYMVTNYFSPFVFDFYNYDAVPAQFFLDNIVITIPEPSAIALASFGVTAFLALRRRR